MDYEEIKIPENQEFLGDMVYAETESGTVILSLGDRFNPTDTIVLIPEVIQSLIEYSVRHGIIDKQ